MLSLTKKNPDQIDRVVGNIREGCGLILQIRARLKLRQFVNFETLQYRYNKTTTDNSNEQNGAARTW